MTRRRRLALIVLVGAVAALLLLGAQALVVEPSSLEVHRVTLALPGWPATHAPLSVALLADLHTGAPWQGLDELARIVATTNSLRPDLVLLLGDYVIHGVIGGHFVPPEQSAPLLGRLVAPLGVYAVLGNHDHWFDGPRVRAALESAGIVVLEDRARRIERPGGDFWLVGLKDYWEDDRDLAGAIAPLTDGLPALAFTHNPDVFSTLPGRFALVLAGHTHGGQVDLPLVGRPIVPSHFGQRYASGHIVEDGRHLFVTTGIGTSILPVRFRVPPEIVLLELRAEE
jgi:predicted MPP superfamily phosphohydrolase